jgi:gliding motility-associated-like protein
MLLRKINTTPPFMKSTFLSLLLSFVFSLCGKSQIITGGSAIALQNDCYRLTTAANALSGYAYESQSISLNDSFDFSFSVNLGSNPAGADGMMFVLRTSLNPSQLIAGGTGGSIGFTGSGLENGSLGVEIDTYQNNDLGDPSYDHVAVFKNASTNHNLSNALTAAVQAASASVNIEDGNNHSFRVKWDPSNLTLSVYFDCDLRVQYASDIVTNIFAGNADVYYGFIATTGGVNNQQSFCYAQSIDSFLIDLVNDSICKGESVQLLAGTTPASFSWSPTTGLNSSSIPNPTASPNLSTDYIVTANYLCESKTDTVSIHVFETDANTFSLGNDTIICTPESATFDLSSTNYAGYLWQDGSTNNQYTSSVTQLVSVQITDLNGCTFSDQTNVEVRTSPNLNLGNDPVSCNGDTILIQPPFPANQYLWSSGATTASILVNTSGTFWLEITNDGICYSRDTVNVETVAAPPLELGNDTSICANNALKLSASSSDADQYKWSTSEQDSVIYVLDSGLYWVQVKLGKCFFSDSILVEPKPAALLDLGIDTAICRGDSLFIGAQLPNAERYLWSDNFEDSTRYISSPGNYSVLVTFENGCETIGAIEISEITCATTLIMPNVFSPNEDGVNDFFEAYESSGINSAEIRIFNRWGVRVYNGTLDKTPWDGTTNGRLCPAGAYFYWVDYVDVYGQTLTEKGSLTLIR